VHAWIIDQTTSVYADHSTCWWPEILLQTIQIKNAMYFLVYLSSTSGLLSEQQLSDILTKSQTNNHRLGITGLLLYNDGNVIQVLEGEKDTVQKLYKLICTDERHSGAFLMVEGHSATRNFPDWAMGFKIVTKQDWNLFAGYFNLDKQDMRARLNNRNASIVTAINSYMHVNIRA
jgi:hypothetical protein